MASFVESIRWPLPPSMNDVATVAAYQAWVDARLEELLLPLIGQVLGPVERGKAEKAAREFLLVCRTRKLIAFRDVQVKIVGEGDIEVTYDR